MKDKAHYHGHWPYATATGLSSMMDGAISHEPITRFFSNEAFGLKTLWQHVKKSVREVESEAACLIFDHTIQV